MSYSDYMRRIATGDVLAPSWMDSREVFTAGELEGFEIFNVNTGRALTGVRCCRSCAWGALA